MVPENARRGKLRPASERFAEHGTQVIQETATEMRRIADKIGEPARLVGQLSDRCEQSRPGR